MFIAVNVNPYNVAVADVAVYSRSNGLESIPSWHFLTGSVAQLRSVWQSYGVYVNVPDPSADVEHTSLTVFVDPHGVERYVAVPMVDHTSSGNSYLPAGPLASWGKGISLVATGLTG